MLACGIVLIPIVIWSAYYLFPQNYPLSVNDLFEIRYGDDNKVTYQIFRKYLETNAEPTLTIKDNAIFNSEKGILYLVPPDRTLSGPGSWNYSVRISDLVCENTNENDLICKPFDPSLARAYKFKGILQMTNAGKTVFLNFKDIDFDASLQLVNGTWKPITLGEYEISIDEKK